MAEKYYAVRAGKRTGIFGTWEECRDSVHGYSGAVYKSFGTKEEADAYLKQGSGADPEQEKETEGEKGGIFLQKNVSEPPERVKIYVDGSYNNLTEEFSYGMVVLGEEGEEKFNRKFTDKELSSMRNVAGEIKGAEAAMQYAMDHRIKAIDIYYDYEGIARWCLGDWKTNRDGTKAYKAFFDRASQVIDIRFVKVAGHSNDKYNDMADELAKEALGIAVQAAGAGKKPQRHKRQENQEEKK